MNGNVDNSRKSNLASLAMPGLVLIALGISYFTYRAPLETARPISFGQYAVPGPPSPMGFSAVFARLWQDPFSVAYEDRNSRQVGRREELENLKALQDLFKKIVEQIRGESKLLCMPADAAPGVFVYPKPRIVIPR